jgi:Fe-Mn family superoxide dismutase
MEFALKTENDSGARRAPGVRPSSTFFWESTMETVAVNEIKAVAPFELPPLPYAHNALEPFVSERTVTFHYEKHHRKYVATANGLVKGTRFEKSELGRIIEDTAGNADFKKLFNNAAQAWNHWFYWNCMTHGGGGEPKGSIGEAIRSSFGSYAAFAAEFIDAAVGQFGSGYAWLVLENGKLKVMKTSDADNPVAHRLKPIAGIDVWEHAYYLDYQNRREEYVKAFLDRLINWHFAEANLTE